MAEENYKPNGWLGIQLAKAVWIPCWSVEKANESEALLVQRAKAHALGASSSTSSTTVLTQPSSTSSEVNANTSIVPATSDVMALLKQMQAQLGSLEERVNSLEQEIAKARPGQ